MLEPASGFLRSRFQLEWFFLFFIIITPFKWNNQYKKNYHKPSCIEKSCHNKHAECFTIRHQKWWSRLDNCLEPHLGLCLLQYCLTFGSERASIPSHDSWGRDLVIVVFKVDAVSCPPPSGTACMPAGGPPDKGPSPMGQHGGCSAGHADPAHPAQALAVPQATQSISGGSLSVGMLEKDQVEKLGHAGERQQLLARLHPLYLLALGAGSWIPFVITQLAVKKHNSIRILCWLLLTSQRSLSFSIISGWNMLPPLPYSDPILLIMAVSFC